MVCHRQQWMMCKRTSFAPPPRGPATGTRNGVARHPCWLRGVYVSIRGGLRPFFYARRRSLNRSLSCWMTLTSRVATRFQETALRTVYLLIDVAPQHGARGAHVQRSSVHVEVQTIGSEKCRLFHFIIEIIITAHCDKNGDDAGSFIMWNVHNKYVHRTYFVPLCTIGRIPSPAPYHGP